MTCDEGLTEGLGRALAVRTREEATGVTVAIPVAPVLPSLPLAGNCRELTMPDNDVPEGPIAPRNADDPTKSDEFDQNELAQKSPGYAAALMESAVANATAPLKARIAELEGEVGRRQAANNMLVRRTDELTEGLKAKEAKPASVPKGRNVMDRSKFNTVMISLTSIAIGILFGLSQSTGGKVNVLTDYYVQEKFGSPEALRGKTYLEVTPEMEAIGIARFASVAEKLPYADAATMQHLLLNANYMIVADMWGKGAGTVVRLQNWCDSGLDPFSNDVILDDLGEKRSVLIHPHPVSANVYRNAKENDVRGMLCANDFQRRALYSATGIDRLVASAATQPPATYDDLATLGDMYVMNWDANSRVLHLIGAYGGSESFVHLSDDDYFAARAGVRPYNQMNTLKNVMGYAWWRENITERATKEEEARAAVK